MRMLPVLTFGVLGWMLLDATSASAAWDNAFQVTCNSCRPSRSSFFAPAPAPCCPTTSYRQRCYYQAYTAYKNETYMEPVTTYRTSYYYEPTTSYRYTSYYDPCTGCCQQVAQPITSYKLRSQCNAVQSYVQRCKLVPVTAYRQSFYYEPVVSQCCPDPCATGDCANGNCAPPSQQGAPAPYTEPGSQMPRPGVQESGGNLPAQNLPTTGTTPRYAPPPPVRSDRLGSYSKEGRLDGNVVADDRFTPRGNVRLVFASRAEKVNATVDGMGRFSVNLPAGDWTIYVEDEAGKPTYHSSLAVRPNDRRQVMVVSR